MIAATPHMRILLVVAPVDFRKGIDGLAAVCRHEPLSIVQGAVPSMELGPAQRGAAGHGLPEPDAGAASGGPYPAAGQEAR
jgi:hypothetical protein